MEQEQRRAMRRRTLKGGKIVFNEGFSTISCTVANLSETGALLRVTSSVGIPDRFALLVGDFDAVSHQCRIVRRSGEQLAVAFADDQGERRPTIDSANAGPSSS